MFDLNATLKRLGYDRELLELLVRVFIDDAPVLLRQIESQAAAAEWREVHRAAHSLRGLAANLDASNVTALSLKLEQQTNEAAPNPAQVRELVLRLESDVQSTIDALRALGYAAPQ